MAYIYTNIWLIRLVNHVYSAPQIIGNGANSTYKSLSVVCQSTIASIVTFEQVCGDYERAILDLITQP